MNAYGFVVDFRENVLRVGQEKIVLDVETEDKLVQEEPNCVMKDWKNNYAHGRKAMLVPKLNLVPVGEAAGEKVLVAHKQDIAVRRKDILDIQGMNKFRDVLDPLVTGSEKVSEDNFMQVIGNEQIK